MTIVLAWRVPDPPVITRWRGPAGMADAIVRNPAAPIAAIIGPPGRQGPIGPVGVTTTEAVASVTIANPGTPLALNRATRQFKIANANSKPDAFVIGLTVAATASGFIAQAKVGMFTLSDWTAVAGTSLLSVGLPYFLAPGGGITATPPAPPSCLTVIGIAVSSTTINVEPSPPLQL